VQTVGIHTLWAASKQLDSFEPELNPKVISLREHYGTVMLPACIARHPIPMNRLENA
jgi:hypothetical protein